MRERLYVIRLSWYSSIRTAAAPTDLMLILLWKVFSVGREFMRERLRLDFLNIVV